MAQVVTLRLNSESILPTVAVEQFKGLDEMQECVGGLIAPVNVSFDDYGNSIDIYVNDEGLLKGLPVNLYASDIATAQYEFPYHLVGSAFIAKHNDEGSMVDLSNEEINKLFKIIGLAA